MSAFDHDFIYLNIFFFPHISHDTVQETTVMYLHVMVTDEVREQTVLNVFLLKCSTYWDGLNSQILHSNLFHNVTACTAPPCGSILLVFQREKQPL